MSVSTNYLIMQASVKRNYFTFKYVREIWEIFKKGQGKSGKSGQKEASREIWEIREIWKREAREIWREIWEIWEIWKKEARAF